MSYERLCTEFTSPSPRKLCRCSDNTCDAVSTGLCTDKRLLKAAVLVLCHHIQPLLCHQERIITAPHFLDKAALLNAFPPLPHCKNIGFVGVFTIPYSGKRAFSLDSGYKFCTSNAESQKTCQSWADWGGWSPC